MRQLALSRLAESSLTIKKRAVDVHDVLASAHLARITRARFVTLPPLVPCKPLGVVSELRVVRAAAPALAGGLDTEVGGTGAEILAELRGEDSAVATREGYAKDQGRRVGGKGKTDSVQRGPRVSKCCLRIARRQICTTLETANSK